jgi:hypothetical protein
MLVNEHTLAPDAAAERILGTLQRMGIISGR